MRAVHTFSCSPELCKAAAHFTSTRIQMITSAADIEPAAVFIIIGAFIGTYHRDKLAHLTVQAVGIYLAEHTLSAWDHFRVTVTTEHAGRHTVKPLSVFVTSYGLITTSSG